MSALAVVERDRLSELEATVERGLATFVQVGEALMEIRETRLYRESYGTFEDYCRERWQFSRQRAAQLIEAAAVSTMVDVPNERQARELAPLLDEPEALREAWAEVVELHPEPTAADVRQAVRQRRERPAVEPPPAPVGVYATVVIDPPWRYDNKATRGAAEDHYATMSLEELRALEVPAAGDAHLYLWVTNGMLREGFELCEAWGFVYKALLTWVKPQIGLGNYFRNATEHVMFGLRGRLPTNGSTIPTWFKADRTQHSRKPDAFYDLVEKASPGPRLEMFARRQRDGWDAWGDEA